MNIARLNMPITLEKNETTIDAIGNHLNSWEHYYRTMATISGETGHEDTEAGTTQSEGSINFTLRFCKAISAVTTTGFRIIFQGETYNILAIDHMNYRHTSVKFKCEKGDKHV